MTITTEQVTTYITTAISVASIVAAVLPQGDKGVWGAIRTVIDAVAMNWGNARNEKKS
jgi:hypothetical protein